MPSACVMVYLYIITLFFFSFLYCLCCGLLSSVCWLSIMICMSCKERDWRINMVSITPLFCVTPSFLSCIVSSPVWLSQEKELWLQACYSLALKVADQRSLQTLQRIQLSEKSWSKLASHFNIILSDKDTQQASSFNLNE